MVRTVSRLVEEVPQVALWTIEGVLVCTALIVVLLFGSYLLAVRNSLAGWLGVALCATSFSGLGAYVLSRFDVLGSRVKSLFLVCASFFASLLAFVVYQQEMVNQIGAAGSVVNSAKVEVLVSLLLGAVLVFLWVWLRARAMVRLRNGAAELVLSWGRGIGVLVLVSFGVVLVAVVLRAESLAGLVAGMLINGLLLGTWFLFSGAALENNVEQGSSSLLLFVAMFALVLGPLVL